MASTKTALRKLSKKLGQVSAHASPKDRVLVQQARNRVDHARMVIGYNSGRREKEAPPTFAKFSAILLEQFQKDLLWLYEELCRNYR